MLGKVKESPSVRHCNIAIELTELMYVRPICETNALSIELRLALRKTREKLPRYKTPQTAKKTSTTDHKLLFLKSFYFLFFFIFKTCLSIEMETSLCLNGTIRLRTKASLLSKCQDNLSPLTDVQTVGSSIIFGGSVLEKVDKKLTLCLTRTLTIF